MGISQEKPNTIYDEEERIQSKDVAHEIANLEKPAREREIALENEAKSGISPEEGINLSIIASLEKECKKSPKYDSDGNPYYLVPSEKAPYSDSYRGMHIYFIHKRGLYELDFSYPMEYEALKVDELIRDIKFKEKSLQNNWRKPIKTENDLFLNRSPFDIKQIVDVDKFIKLSGSSYNANIDNIEGKVTKLNLVKEPTIVGKIKSAFGYEELKLNAKRREEETQKK